MTLKPSNIVVRAFDSSKRMVHGEEKYMISHLNSLRYMELDGEFIETPFQHFEEVSPEVAATKAVSSISKITRLPLRMSSLKDATAVVEEGGCTIWGKLPDIPYKSDRFGLGFTSTGQKVGNSFCDAIPTD